MATFDRSWQASVCGISAKGSSTSDSLVGDMGKLRVNPSQSIRVLEEMHGSVESPMNAPELLNSTAEALPGKNIDSKLHESTLTYGDVTILQKEKGEWSTSGTSDVGSLGVSVNNDTRTSVFERLSNNSGKRVWHPKPKQDRKDNGKGVSLGLESGDMTKGDIGPATIIQVNHSQGGLNFGSATVVQTNQSQVGLEPMAQSQAMQADQAMHDKNEVLEEISLGEPLIGPSDRGKGVHIERNRRLFTSEVRTPVQLAKEIVSIVMLRAVWKSRRRGNSLDAD
ncbi:hypothetical protein L6452_09094 [Arctium lappa]|uniref:Uncharacterized protein n=1 Tax=Arctium lappa TaxID=4217 RepID=A0ACB9DJF3_ARCLA|nr:hypothetical protein L6452_09094 [Arctium lappa]